ncbi:FAD-dependent oxidoreductase [Bradyrhizobium sp. LHD-71]|uniref:FAD-dependent oxidoreductase n=1 Tax=Bradyrhizobium sp. LHD-71 TaxID=3072141 RepID=UPI00280FD69C|nr:FAD-dependent oxidoreductase [Bradyrhizobium sp. LHD-71]MDQ8731399.1 FAD-dependent oxidoreductase [Bradyrhizobium sp. LHD-71]
MTSRSLWMDIDVAPDSRPLDADQRCDVVVIGSGIAGLSTAHELAKHNLSVIVVDRGRICSGMTARTTAHLSPLCDDFVGEMKKLRGLGLTKGFYQSQAEAIARIEEIQKTEGIDCDFRRLDGYLFQGPRQSAEKIDEELDAARSIGMPVDRLVGVSLEGCADRQTLRYPDQAAFHPLRYLAGVARVCANKGTKFFSESAVQEVVEDGGGVKVKTSRAVITANAAVIATNSPIVDRYALHTKMAPYRTYAMAFSIPAGALPDALYWDTEDPYHYVRLQPGSRGKDYVIVGGEDHKTGEADDAEKRFSRLEDWARELIPTLQNITHRWSGQVLETIDYAGFIGRNPGSKHVYVATGDSGQGMTHGVASALINADLITHGKSTWAAVYAPDRKPVAAIGNYLRENATALKNFAEYVTPGEIASLDELQAGQGAILRQGLKKIAAYREPSGALQLYSAACTHVGCQLHFNSFEHTWDCPCHGSIFDVDGQPLNAPAISPLQAADESTPEAKERTRSFEHS